MALDRIACRGLVPDLTLLIDIDAETSLARAHARNASEPHGETRMDEQSLEFHRQVYQAYHALAAREPERFRVIDGRAGVEPIAAEIWRAVAPYV
jgi:dTMP kinase